MFGLKPNFSGMRLETRSITQSAAFWGSFSWKRKKSRERLAEDRHLALVDAVSVDDDKAVFGLAEDGFQHGDRDDLGGDHVAQHVARANRRELVHIANQQQVAALVDGAKQVVHQQDIDHRGLVDDHQVGVQRVLLIAQEWTPGARFELQQAVDRLGFQTGGLSEPFGGPPGWRSQKDGVVAGLEQADDRAGDGAFAGARSAG